MNTGLNVFYVLILKYRNSFFEAGNITFIVNRRSLSHREI